VKLLQLQVDTKSGLVQCSTISRDGLSVAYANAFTVKAFHLSFNGDEVQVKALQLPRIPNVQKLAFLSNSTLAAIDSKSVMLLDILAGDVHVLRSEDEDDSVAPIIAIAVSKDEKWLAVGDLLNRIRIFDLEAKEYFCTVPVLNSLHSAISFHPSSPTLVISAGEELYFYDVVEQEFTPWSRDLTYCTPRNYTTCAAKDEIVGIDFNEDTMLLWATTFLCLVDLKNMQSHNESKSNATKRAKISPIFKIVGRYTGVLFAGFIESKSSGKGKGMGNSISGGLVVVERPWFDILQSLGGVFERHKFAT